MNSSLQSDTHSHLFLPSLRFLQPIPRLFILFFVLSVGVSINLWQSRSLLAATITVNTAADETSTNGLCSLREAVTNANNNAATQPDCTAGSGVDLIQFSPALTNGGAQTISLGGTSINIASSLTITGPGANLLAVSGNDVSRVFNVASGTNVAISDLTITKGFSASQAGGLQNSGTLTLSNCVITDNRAPQAGGLQNDGVLTMNRCLVSYNATTSGYGGGMVIFGPRTDIINSTFSNNTSAIDSGAIGADGNTTLEITNSTIAYNRASTFGGGIVKFGSSNVILHNSIVAKNSSGSGGKDIDGTINSASSFNLIGTTGNGGLTNGTNGNIIGVSNPRIAPLGDYGGPTQTHIPYATSQAINAGTSSNAPSTDQRGVSRPQGSGIDMGAVEQLVVISPTTIPTRALNTLYSDVVFTASGGTGPYTWALITGTLPTGVSFYTSTATLAGTPTQTGIFTFAITATDANGFAGGAEVSLAVIVPTPLCFATHDNGSTLFSSTNSQAVRDAVAAASSGADVLVAGYCAGVTGNGVLTQVITIDKPLTLLGGYKAISGTGTVDWNVRDFALYSTTLDALGSGRVITTSKPLTVENLIIQNGLVNDLGGGGIYAANSLWLGGSQISNSVTSGSFEASYGGGVYVAGAADITGTIFVSNSATSSDGGGLYVDGSALVIGSSFQFNDTGVAGGGAFISGTATITGTTFLSNSASSAGGGLHTLQDTTIDNSTFIGNVAQGEGGGASAEASVTVRKSQFISNTGSSGGGLRIINFAATVEETLFQGNLASFDAGGGIYVFNTSLSMRNSQLISNSAAFNGGGVCVLGSATISATLFQANNAIGNGGGAFLDKAADVTGSTFFSNSAQLAGGGVYLKGNVTAPLTLVNNRFARNQSLANEGDAVTMRGNVTTSHLTFIHNTLANPLQEDGAAIHVQGGTVDISNTIITSHTVAIQRVGGTVQADYNLFDTVSKPVSGTVTAGTHSIIGMAAFVDAAQDDYHLLESSAAIDKANTSTVLNDFDGTARPQAAAPDIGAFESSFGLPSLSIGDGNLAEGNSGHVTITLPITLSFAKAVTVTANFTTFDGSAQTSKNDYLQKSGVVQFPPGTTNTTIQIVVLGDTLVEGNENLLVRLSTPTFATLVDDTATVTILDDDVSTLSISDASVLEGDFGTVSASFVVSLTQTSATTITVNYATSDGTASSSSDYGSVNNILTFAPGVTRRTFNVTVNGDKVVESNETFNISLSSANGATIGDGIGTGTIVNDDSTSLNIGDTNVTEGDSGTVNASFTVALTNPSETIIAVNYATSNGSATSGSDFIHASGTVTFAPGITSQTITVTVNSDRVVEADESFNVTLSNANGATIGDGVGTGTIDNDDSTAVSIGDVSVIEGDSGTVNATFTVTLTKPSATSVRVNYATSDGTASSGSDYVGLQRILTFAPNITLQTITISVNGDKLEETDETFTITLSQPNGATLADGVAVGTILDDDQLVTLRVYLPLVMR